MKADLHMHSTYSDGKLTPVEVFKRAKKNGVDIVSITDHDICSGNDNNKKLANEVGIQYIPGIELSTIYKNKSVHVLGYFKDDSYNSKEMTEYTTFIKNKREQRARLMIDKLKEHFDIDIKYETVLSYGRGIIARPHIAKAIHDKYPEYSFDYIFKTFIGDNNKAYVPSAELPTKEGIELLRRNNCVVVLAHPILLKEHIKEDVMSYDYDGIEAIYYRNTSEEEKKLKEFAQKRGIIITAGSDYHGIENDSNHGDIGTRFITGTYLDMFLEKYSL
jgi:predicted metal-dependent phosphoesterase TrpH